MDKSSGIYCITSVVDGRVYIGSSKSLTLREKRHFAALYYERHCNMFLQRAYNKYGRDNFTFSVLEYVEDLSLLTTREQFWIECCKSANSEHGFNLAPVAGSWLGLRHEDSAKIKIADANAKSFSGFVDPYGDDVPTFRNMQQFCRERSLNAAGLHMLLTQDVAQYYRGYTHRRFDSCRIQPSRKTLKYLHYIPKVI